MKRGFTLLEVLVALAMISIVIAGSLTMTSKYIANAKWDQLFERFERKFFDVNAYALAGFSSNPEKIFPEMRHLIFQPGLEESGVWYLETVQKKDSSDEKERTVSFAEEFYDFDIFPLRLENIVLREGSDPEAGTPVTLPRLILTWASPFSQLFFLTSNNLNSLPKQTGDAFTFEPERPACRDYPKFCTVTLTYVRPGTEQRKNIIIDLQKGIEREFK